MFISYRGYSKIKVRSPELVVTFSPQLFVYIACQFEPVHRITNQSFVFVLTKLGVIVMIWGLVMFTGKSFVRVTVTVSQREKVKRVCCCTEFPDTFRYEPVAHLQFTFHCKSSILV